MVILGHLLPFYPLKTPKMKILKNEKICWRYRHFTLVYQKSQSYDVWFLRYGVRQTEFFCHYGPFFALLPFYFFDRFLPPGLILQLFTINDSLMIYGFSDMECNRQNFLSFWTVFCRLPNNPPEKSKFWETEKSP